MSNYTKLLEGKERDEYISKRFPKKNMKVTNDMIKLKRYKQNLKVIGSGVYSYDTLVAEIVGNKLYKVKWRVNGISASQTTTKHINYVAKELNLELI